MSRFAPGAAPRVTTSWARRSLASPATLAVLAASVGLVTACSSGGSHSPSADPSASSPAASASATPPPPTSAAGGSAAPACSAPDISQGAAHSVTPQSAVAGTSYYAIVVSNVSGSTCSLTGYLSDVGYETSPVDGRQVGSMATDQAVNSPGTVTLAPGATAYATLSVKAPGDYGSSECDPVFVDDLSFGLPGENAAYDTPVGPVDICNSLPASVGSQLGIAAIQQGNGDSNPEL